MTTQIDFFEQLIEENVYNASDLNNSLALLSALGNDYFDYLKHGSIWGFKSFVDSLVNQMTTNLIRIQKLGVKKIVVTSLPPFGCIPAISGFNPLKRCLNIINIIPIAHNKLLNQSITKLNQETIDGATFVFLDLYDSFMSVINDPSTNNITEYYTACCLGVSSKYVCGSVDENNEKQYKVCENPESTMFWDPIHPTQAGWHAVYNNLQMDDLGQLQC
uniref:GDSL esterase/lipase n=2 Tax=Lotus japonicus TaxID=34305 RepID=I3SYW6_LOTJA|nr:unknown [Lotus japonicus]